jgi:3-polyprenyl-4-hydroxybenzoate decarboxylase
MNGSSSDRFQRAPVVRSYDVRDRMVLVGTDGSARELRGDSAHLARAVLGFLVRPHTRDEIRAHVEVESGGALDESGMVVVDELLALLVETGALISGSDAEPASPPPRPGTRRLVLCLSGAIAAMHAPSLVLLLQRRGFEIRVVATDDALRFVRREAVEALVHHRVLSELFADEGGFSVPHIELARWADVVLVWPASGTTLSRLATGDYSSLVSAVALTARVPVIVVPSMNGAMHESPATRRNIEQLIDDGMYVVQPSVGIEVADPPDRRAPAFGPAPPHDVVVHLVESVLRSSQ